MSWALRTGQRRSAVDGARRTKAIEGEKAETDVGDTVSDVCREYERVLSALCREYCRRPVGNTVGNTVGNRTLPSGIGWFRRRVPHHSTTIIMIPWYLIRYIPGTSLGVSSQDNALAYLYIGNQVPTVSSNGKLFNCGERPTAKESFSGLSQPELASAERQGRYPQVARLRRCSREPRGSSTVVPA